MRVFLSGRECDVLSVLAAHPGRTVIRETLLEAVWRWGGRAPPRPSTSPSAGCASASPPPPPHQVLAVRGVGHRLEPPES